jgi:hypothetical protein
MKKKIIIIEVSKAVLLYSDKFINIIAIINFFIKAIRK